MASMALFNLTLNLIGLGLTESDRVRVHWKNPVTGKRKCATYKNTINAFDRWNEYHVWKFRLRPGLFEVWLTNDTSY